MFICSHNHKNSVCSIPVKKLISSTRMNTYMTISEMLSCSSVLPSEAVKHVQVKSNVFQETVYRRKQYLNIPVLPHIIQSGVVAEFRIRWVMGPLSPRRCTDFRLCCQKNLSVLHSPPKHEETLLLVFHGESGRV